MPVLQRGQKDLQAGIDHLNSYIDEANNVSQETNELVSINDTSMGITNGPFQRLALPSGGTPSVIDPAGALSSTGDDAYELPFAQEISEFRGVTYQGTPYRHFPGIDGWIDDEPVSLKQITSGNLPSIRGAVETAIRKARSQHYTGVELFIKASDFSVTEVINYI